MQPTSTPGAAAHHWMIVLTVILGSFTSVLDSTIIGVALPQMLSTFGVSLDAMSWIAVSYAIGTILMTTMASWWSAMVGRKRFYLFSFTLFTVASLGCGLARSWKSCWWRGFCKDSVVVVWCPWRSRLSWTRLPTATRGKPWASTSWG